MTNANGDAAAVTPPAAAKQLMTLDWLTLREIANEAGVSVEVVRQWCIRHREGEPGGLRYAHFGAEPEDKAARVNYRVHVGDWKAFQAERLKQEQRRDRETRKWVEAPIDYV